MWAGVEHLMTDAVRAVALGGIPKGEQPIWRQCFALPESVEFCARQRTFADCGPVDFPGIKVADESAAQRVLVACPGYQERHAWLVVGLKAEVLDDMAGEVVGDDLANQRIIAVERALLVELSAAGVAIIGDADQIPDLRQQRQFGGDIVDLRAVADPKFQMPGRVDAERIACIAQRVPAPENRLPCAALRHRRPDESRQRKTAGNRKFVFRIDDLKIAAELGKLLLDRPAAIDWALQLDLDVTGTGFMRVTVDKPDELRFRFARPIAIHEESDFSPGRTEIRLAYPKIFCWAIASSLSDH